MEVLPRELLRELLGTLQVKVTGKGLKQDLEQAALG
jgi:hypothetical protein